MNSEILKGLLAAHAIVTIFMAGLIWFVQIVHYPLFKHVGNPEFPRYEQEHTRRTGWLVSAPMLIEFSLAAALAFWLGGALAWGGLGMLMIIWLSTATRQVPLHQRLLRGFDQTAHKQLVRSNWVRTIGWSLRAILALFMLFTP